MCSSDLTIARRIERNRPAVGLVREIPKPFSSCMGNLLMRRILIIFRVTRPLYREKRGLRANTTLNWAKNRILLHLVLHISRQLFDLLGFHQFAG